MARLTTAFQLVPADVKDIPDLARIHVTACKPDLAISLYFPSDADFESRVISMLQAQIGEPNWTHVKCLDSETGETAGWASWVMVKYSAEEIAARKRPTEGKEGFKFLPGLGQYVKQETEHAFIQWASEKPHYQLKALFVEPRFQRRGMGSAMVTFGNQLTDRENLPAICQASPYGYPTYASLGFKVFGELNVDLKDWAPGGREGDKGWGLYRYRLMARMPSQSEKDT